MEPAEVSESKLKAVNPIEAVLSTTGRRIAELLAPYPSLYSEYPLPPGIIGRCAHLHPTTEKYKYRCFDGPEKATYEILKLNNRLFCMRCGEKWSDLCIKAEFGHEQAFTEAAKSAIRYFDKMELSSLIISKGT